MGRRKIEIKAIKDDRNRSVTFLKRKGGLFKKAHELSVLCSVDVAVFVFGSNKKLYEYSSSDMRELITRYTYHGGPSEHKGPADFNGGADEEEEDGEGTPPNEYEGSVEPQMVPPHFAGQPQPPFPQLRGQTPSASPPINGVPFVSRGHTPQPPMGSRPSSRNDFRRGPSMQAPVAVSGPPQAVPNGYAYIPHPAIYNPQSQPPMPPNMQQGPYPYAPPQPQMQQYMEDQRRSSVPPPSYPQQVPPPVQQQRPQPSPQPQQQQLPPQAVPQMSPPQPPNQRLEPPPPQQQQLRPPQELQPPAPMEPRPGLAPGKPSAPLLDTSAAIKKAPQRKQHSIFTPIDENRSILSQHLASFVGGTQQKEDAGANRSQSLDMGGVSQGNEGSSPPTAQRSTVPVAKGRDSISSIPETTFTTPSRSNSLRAGGGGAPRPKLKVQIPDEASEAGSNTAGSSTSPRNSSDTNQSARRNGDPPSSGVVLPPPSPSASTLLSAGATGPPNPFARPPPQIQNNGVHIETPASALPSRYLNNEFLPSPSSFYPDWNFRGNDSNTLPSPLNFTTPVVGTGPSFLRDDNPNKRKSPDLNTAGPSSDPPEGNDAKRLKVDS